MEDREIIESIINRVSAQLTKDMSDDDSKEAIREYRDLLELTLDKISEEDKQWFSDFEVENVAKLDATNRLEYIRQEKASLEIGALEKEAWDIAMKYSNNEEENTTKLKETAKNLKLRIEVFADGLKKVDSHLVKRFARIISEALLDCEYIIGDKQIASLRMGRILRQQRTK